MTRLGFSLVIRLGERRSPLSPFVTASLLAHLFATAALAILPSLHHRATPIGDAWVVGLAAPPASAGGGGGGAVAPSRPSPARDTGVRLDTPKPAPPVKDTKKTKKDEKEKPAAKPDASLPPAGPMPPAGPQLAGGPGGPSGTGQPGVGAAGGTGIFSMDIGDAQLAWYRAAVVASLQSRWVRPVLEGVRGTLSVSVAFEVERDGTIRNARVDASSGVPSLDRSALRAVEEASPLPPLPSGWGQPPFAARFEFRFTPGNP